MDRRQQILEELLILEAGRGDREAFQQLVERWQERLWRYARSLTGEDDAAWDVLQEVWIAVTGNLGRLRNPASFRCWVYTIVTRKASNHRRSARRHEKPLVEDPAEDRREDLDRAEKVAALREALARLPGERSALLALHYVEGFELSQIAEILGIPEGTVKSRLHHARGHLKEILERMKP